MAKDKSNRYYLSEELYRQCLDLLPIVTVDVLFFDRDLNKTLLFRRENEPLKGMYYSVGGRIYKNENFLITAIRICKEEAGVILNKADLTFGAVTEEIFHNSIFEDINAHNVNIFFGHIIKEKMSFVCDDQHSCYKWFKVDDPNLHPYIAQKIHILLSNFKSSIL